MLWLRRIAWLREERDQHGRQHQREASTTANTTAFAPQHRQPLRARRSERRADHPGRVLAADHEHAEHADRELRHVHAGQRGVERAPVGALVAGSGGSSGARGWSRRGAGSRPSARRRRASTSASTAASEAWSTRRRATRALVHVADALEARQRGGDGRHGAHAAPPRAPAAGAASAAWYSTCVARQLHERLLERRLNCGVSSCSTIWLAAAISPTWSDAEPADLDHLVAGHGHGHVRAARPGRPARAPAASAPCTSSPDARRTNSSTAMSAIRFAAPDHDQVVGGQRHLAHQVRGDEDRATLGGEPLEQVADPLDALGVEAVHRLVEDQRRGIAEQRGGDAEPLAHPERELSGALARDVVQTDEVDQLRRRAASGCRASAPARAGGCRPTARCAPSFASSSAPTSCSGAGRSR